MKLVESSKQIDALEKRTYTIEIHGGKEPQKFSIDAAFPFYSPEREKELIKEAITEKMKSKL